MDSYIGKETVENIDIHKFQKIIFVYNALEDGWAVAKKGDNYVFRKKHYNDKEIFLDSYLNNFIKSNSSLEKITS